MRILYYGDVFGRPGREAVLGSMPRLRREHAVDFVVICGENAAHGRGITPEMCEEFFNAGVDVITTGNHVWDQKALIAYLDRNDRVLRPANCPPGTVGKEWVIVPSRRDPSLKLGVFQVMGRVFMDPLDCPFRTADRVIGEIRAEGASAILADFHGEATSEKQAFAHHLDGRVGFVVGSHSHVQTADERILPGGTAAITDAGMCGCFDSVIGVKKEVSIQKFLTRMPIRFEPAEGPGGIGAAIAEIGGDGLARSILRIREDIVRDGGA